MVSGYLRRPDWLKLTPVDHAVRMRMDRLLNGLRLHSVCESARCPNRDECYASGTATFMILGDSCTRKCTFCGVNKGCPSPADPGEPGRVVEAVARLGLRYAVVTSVTRDDLEDGGAGEFAAAIEALRAFDPDIGTEVLVPDFSGDLKAVETVTASSPAVFAHNLETAPRLYKQVRPAAVYERSLGVLEHARRAGANLLTKSGLMLGLGETRLEVAQVMADLRKVGCDMLTIGQYLPPSLRHYPVQRYAPPAEYEEYRRIGLEMGFRSVVAGPLVRSSFHAASCTGLSGDGGR